MVQDLSLHNFVSRIGHFPGMLRALNVLGKLRGRIGDGKASIGLWPGSRFEVDLHDRIQRHMWGGCYEPDVRRCLEALLVKGDVFLDVGAHIGYYAAIAGHQVGPRGKVFAFEPDPVLYKRLVRNTADLSWVQAFQSALWVQSGTLLLERSSFQGESGWNTLTSVRNLGKGEHVRVQALSLDDWSAARGIDRLQAIKIDAEGSDLAILKGARTTVARFRPWLFVEDNPVLLEQARTSSVELRRYLLGEDYSLFSPWRSRLRRLDGEKLSPAGEFLCLPNARIGPLLATLSKAGLRVC
jgi:FkbM family methyltransferase